jgi:hypothetical protein
VVAVVHGIYLRYRLAENALDTLLSDETNGRKEPSRVVLRPIATVITTKTKNFHAELGLLKTT